MTDIPPIRITAEQFTTALEAAVEARGADYVYPADTESGIRACYYRDGDEPLCLVGDALSRILTPEQFVQYVPNRVGPSYQPLASGLLRDKFVVDSDVIWAVDSAQAAQDGGAPWGKALGKYKDALTGWWSEQ